MPITTTHTAPRRRISRWHAAELAVATPLVLAGFTGTVELLPAPVFAVLVVASCAMLACDAIAAMTEVPKR